MSSPDGQSNASRGLRVQLADAVARQRKTVGVDPIHLESLLNERDRLAVIEQAAHDFVKAVGPDIAVLDSDVARLAAVLGRSS